MNPGNTFSMLIRQHQLNAVDRGIRYYVARLLGRDGMGEYRSVYENLVSRYNVNSSKFWERHRKKFRREIVARGISNFKDNTYIMEHYSTLREKNVFWSYRMAYTTAVWQYYHYVRSKDRFNILKSADWDNRDWDRIQAVDHFYNIFDFTKHKLTDRITVCEVGGGYGELGSVILDNMPNARYVLVDLPESLLLASYYLRTDVKKKRAQLLLPNEICSLANADVFVNVYSFAEMTPAIVSDYLREFKRLNGKYFYSRNRDIERNKIDGVSVNLQRLLPKSWKIVRSEPSRTYPGFSDMYVKLQ